MFNPLQPAFKVRIFTGKRGDIEPLKGTGVSSGGDYVDIEMCVSYPVTYEESVDLLTHLNFTVDKYADVLLGYFCIGQAVILYGEYYRGNQDTLRKVFSGTVTRVRTKFEDSGHVSFSVECMGYVFTKMGKDKKNFVYPDSKSTRAFAQKDSMSVKDIVEGIAKDNNVQVGGINLSTGARKVDFNKISIRYQKDMSDWQFLAQLAKDFGCTMWIERENDIEKLYFMSWSKALEKQGNISFLYPLNGRVEDIKESEMQRFDDHRFDRPRIIRDVSVEEDMPSADSIMRSSVYFDKETGQQKEVISRIEEGPNGRREIVFYDLNEAKVRYIHEHDPKIADEITRNSPASFEWGTPDNPRNASYYYTEIRRYEEHEAVFDRAYRGITVTAKTNQDLDIRTGRTYKIRGLISYSTNKLIRPFFLRGLKHVWDADGTWTELDFIL